MIYTTEKFIEKAKIIHDNKYNYDKVNYIKSDIKIEIICNKENHGIFLQTPSMHLQKNGCPKCNKSFKLNTCEFIKKAIQVHGNLYDYSNVIYTGCSNKIRIGCKEHQIFLQTPSAHLYGQKCAKCVGNERSNIDNFIKKANEIHDNKYDYSKAIYINRQTKLEIICKKCNHVFWVTPCHHIGTAKIGCSKCSGMYRGGIDYFIEKAIKVHGNLYDYNKVNYVSNHFKIEIVCKKHGEFLQTPHDHLRNHGCPKCVYFISTPEIAWLDSLNISEEYRHKTFFINKKKFNVDAFDLTTKTIYEFYGDYYHGNPKKFSPDEINKKVKKTYGTLYQRTLDREIILKSAGYNIISIWEYDWYNQCKLRKYET